MHVICEGALYADKCDNYLVENIYRDLKQSKGEKIKLFLLLKLKDKKRE